MRPSFTHPILAGAAVTVLLAMTASAVPRPDEPVFAGAAAASSPFVGAWELDLTRMPEKYGPPPKRVRFTFEPVGADQWRTTVDITAPDGSVRHMAVRYRRDGAAAPGEGDLSEADSAAFRSPAPNVLVMGLAKKQMLGSVRVYVVSADGCEMTESAAAVDASGAPFVREFHFKRVP
ncbi:hypothetical protein [Sphingomonas pokkalii]|nr:hypothetical protein [Sphingomonas pokkalii]